MYRTPKLLFILTSLVALSSFGGASAAGAQNLNEPLIPVCVQFFESAPTTDYLTAEEIAEIEATIDDQSDIPPPRITGYPDPLTESCATENGELREYDPEALTPVCVASGPNADGPLVVQFAYTRFLGPDTGIILADPVTGACPNHLTPVPDDDTAALVEALVDTLGVILRDALA